MNSFSCCALYDGNSTYESMTHINKNIAILLLSFLVAINSGCFTSISLPCDGLNPTVTMDLNFTLSIVDNATGAPIPFIKIDYVLDFNYLDIHQQNPCSGSKKSTTILRETLIADADGKLHISENLLFIYKPESYNLIFMPSDYNLGYSHVLLFVYYNSDFPNDFNQFLYLKTNSSL